MQTIHVDRIISEKNVDAALYILSVLLGLTDEVLEGRRSQLAELKQRLESSRQMSDADRKDIVRTYNEVMYS